MPKNRFYITAKLPAHIKAIHVEYMDSEIQTFNFELKPRKEESHVKCNLVFDGNAVETSILFTPVKPTLKLIDNGSSKPN